MIETDQILNDTYKIISRIGSGGGGTVYKAYHKRMQKYVAIKLIKDEIKGGINNRSEVDSLKNLKSDYLPQVLDFVEDGDDVYTVMEFIEGENFRQIIESGRYFTEKQVKKYALQLCTAVEYLHNHIPVIIHSDIKPANIMLTPEDNICLIDFNISMMSKSGAAEAMGGSKNFAAPEQFRKIITAPAVIDGFHEETRYIVDDVTEIISDTGIITAKSATSKTKNISRAVIDTRTDIYGIGATLYYMLTSRVPVLGNPDFRGIRVSPAMKNVIVRAMDAVPAKRFKNVGEMKAALSAGKKLGVISAVGTAVILAAGAAFLFAGGSSAGEEDAIVLPASTQSSSVNETEPSAETFNEIMQSSQISSLPEAYVSESVYGTEPPVETSHELIPSSRTTSPPKTMVSESASETEKPIDKNLSYYDFGAVRSVTGDVNADGSYEVIWYEPNGSMDKIEKYDSTGAMISIILYDGFTGERDDETKVMQSKRGISTVKKYDDYYVIQYYDRKTHKNNLQEYYDYSDNLLTSYKLDFTCKSDGSYEYTFLNPDGTVFAIDKYRADNSKHTIEYYRNDILWYIKTIPLSGEETVEYYDENGNKITETVQVTSSAITSPVMQNTTITSQTEITKPTWSETSLSAIMYITENCYSREGAYIGSTPVMQFYQGDMVEVTALSNTGYYKLADGSYIHSDYISEAPLYRENITIRGIEYSTSLTELTIADVGLTNNEIEPLKYMTNLAKLELHGNNISDISALSGLIKLQELKLSDNHISDITPLSELKNLKILKLGVNNISDISPLKHLINITELHIGVNNISNIDSFDALQNLEFLDVRANKIRDVSPVAKLKKLRDFYIYKNTVTDISMLSKCGNIKTIWIDKNQLDNISGFADNRSIDLMILNDIDDGLLKDVKETLPECTIKLFRDDYAGIYGY